MVCQKPFTLIRVVILGVPPWPKHFRHLPLARPALRPIIPKVMGLWNALTDLFYNSCESMWRARGIANGICHLSCTHTTQQSTHPQELPCSCSCMAGNQDRLASPHQQHLTPHPTLPISVPSGPNFEILFSPT